MVHDLETKEVLFSISSFLLDDSSSLSFDDSEFLRTKFLINSSS